MFNQQTIEDIQCAADVRLLRANLRLALAREKDPERRRQLQGYIDGINKHYSVPGRGPLRPTACALIAKGE